MKLRFLSKSGWLLLLCLISCRPQEKEPTPIEPDQTTQEPGLPTPVGQPAGEATTKTIGPGGGTITTPDGKLSLLFPSGALREETPITIQPVENHVPGPFGRVAYTFKPTELQLLKPVELVRHYESEEINGTAPEAVGIAFQDKSQVWQGRVNLDVDKVNRTLKTTLPGFDYPMGYYEQFFMSPDSAVLVAGQQQRLEIWYVKGHKDTDRDELLVPLPAAKSGHSDFRILDRNQIRNWRVNGELQGQSGKQPDRVSGHFTPADEGAWGTYYAPAAVPPKAYNPVAISVELNLKRQGMIMLVGNFRIVSPGTMTIDGKKYENVDVVASYSKEAKYFSISLSERHPADTKSRASIHASVSRVFRGVYEYGVFNNGSAQSDTKINATDGKDTWAHAYTHAPGGILWGPASITITEFTEKSVRGTLKGTLHNSDPNNHKTIAVSGEFTAAINP